MAALVPLAVAGGEVIGPALAAAIGTKLSQLDAKDIEKAYHVGKALYTLGTKVAPKVRSVAGHLLSPKAIKSAATYAKGLTTARGFKKFFKSDLKKGAAEFKKLAPDLKLGGSSLSTVLGGVHSVVGAVGDIVGAVHPEAGGHISHFHQVIEKYHKKGKHHATVFGALGKKVGLM